MARADEPAFPPHPDRNYASPGNECGLTVREYYIAQVVKGLLSAHCEDVASKPGSRSPVVFWTGDRLAFNHPGAAAGFAALAGELADALLAELAKKKS